MTTFAAPAPRHKTTVPPHPPHRLGVTTSAPGLTHRTSNVPNRTYEIAALRADGSLFIGQHRAPGLAFIEQAFSAFARGTLIQTVHGVGYRLQVEP